MSVIDLTKPQRWQSKKYRDAARGESCKLRLPGCRNETETVVLCHRNGAGMGRKNSDFDAVDGCAHCHALLDRQKFDYNVSREMIEEAFERGRVETMINRIVRGVLK